MRKISNVGVALCLFYIVTSALCVSSGLSNGDVKSQDFMLSVPILWQELILISVRLGFLIYGAIWWKDYLLLGIPTLIGLYFVGQYFDRVLWPKER